MTTHCASKNLPQRVSRFRADLGQAELPGSRHFGSPSTRSPMMLRWISEVPE